jgi:hypothetical protein
MSATEQEQALPGDLARKPEATVTSPSGPKASSPRPGPGDAAASIGGLSVLKGLLLYGATLTFAGFYAYFMERIASASQGSPPALDAAMVSAAAALAGVLGSAFALVIGVPTDPSTTNLGLAEMLDSTTEAPKVTKARAWIWKLLSLEPGGAKRPSWPLTFGIWSYAAVASAVAITYLLNQAETPEAIKALAILFAGYVLAFVTAAYGIAKSK